MTLTFETLPVELVADILGELDLKSLITISHTSKKLNNIASDPFLNPWRKPILRNLCSASYEDDLKNLAVRNTVPRQNWVEILSLASPQFLLFDSTLPNITNSEWEEGFRRRFLPGWTKWRKDGPWKQAFIKYITFFETRSLLLIALLCRILYRVFHRGETSCTSEESWTKSVTFPSM